MNFNFLKYIKDIYLKKGEEVILFEYRTKEKYGWPGDLKVVLSSNKTMIIPSIKRAEVKNYFKLNRCNYCFDKVNIQSDITFGDCYIKGDESKEGKSSIIVRTEKGDEIVNRFSDRLFLEKTDKAQIYESQNLIANKERLRLGLKYTGIYNTDRDCTQKCSYFKDRINITISQLLSRIGANYSGYLSFVILSKTIIFIAKIKKVYRLFNRKKT